MEIDLLSLKWNNHKAAFIHLIKHLRNKETYSDVTLACNGTFYPVHKLVLSSCSEYFSAIFDHTNCKNPVIVLKDIECRNLEYLLDYMYVGEINVKQNELASLVGAAECLKIKGLAVADSDLDSDVKSHSSSNKRSSSSRSKESSPPPKKKRTSRESLSISNEQTQSESNKTTSVNSEIVTIKAEPVSVEENEEGIFLPVSSIEVPRCNSTVTRCPSKGSDADLDQIEKEEVMDPLDGILGEAGPSNVYEDEQYEGSITDIVSCSDVAETSEDALQDTHNYLDNCLKSVIEEDRLPGSELRSYSTTSWKVVGQNKQNEQRIGGFLCDFCTYETINKYHMERHLRVHTGEKPFRCPFCNYRSGYKHAIKRHLKAMHSIRRGGAGNAT